MKGKGILSVIAGVVAGAAAGVAGGVAFAGNTIGKNADKYRVMSNKHLALFQLMNDWLITKQEGKSITEYFNKNSYKSIAVYGLSYVGERVLDELKDSGIEVKYGIDKNAKSIFSDIEVYLPEDELPEVDAIIVTPVYFFDEIYEMLSDIVSCPIISMQDILQDI